jgi:glycine cleavage system aminomethyltransferase T
VAGLGARDSLRLEAGLCLYGNDIDETTSPIEAGLAWTVARARRAEGGFPGAEVILRQLKEGPERRRVGLLSSGPPARGGVAVTVPGGGGVGVVTSGCPSPSLGKGVNVSMAYVERGLTKPGTQLTLQVRAALHCGLDALHSISPVILCNQTLRIPVVLRPWSFLRPLPNSRYSTRKVADSHQPSAGARS